jgi:ABC-type transport system involved in multi-copper enzyme maturation permease subunit
MAKIIPVDIDTVNNPVARAEFKHQRWVIQNSRSGGVWIVLAVALVLPAILLSALYTLLVLLFPIVPNWLQSVQTFMGEFAFVVVTTAAFSLYPVVTLITVGLSANSIRRERHGKTWDALRLTDVSAGTIVFGKWWASLRAVDGDHIMATIVRIGWCATLIAQNIAPVNSGVPVFRVITASEAVLLMLVVIVLALLFGFFDAGISAAFGILTSAPERILGAITAPIVLGLRFVLAFAAAGAMIAFVIAGVYQDNERMITITLLASALYPVLLWMALRFSQRVVD